MSCLQAATVRGIAALAHIKPGQKTCRVGLLCQKDVYNLAALHWVGETRLCNFDVGYKCCTIELATTSWTSFNYASLVVLVMFYCTCLHDTTLEQTARSSHRNTTGNRKPFALNGSA